MKGKTNHFSIIPACDTAFKVIYSMHNMYPYTWTRADNFRMWHIHVDTSHNVIRYLQLTLQAFEGAVVLFQKWHCMHLYHTKRNLCNGYAKQYPYTWKRADSFRMWHFQVKCLISMVALGNSANVDTSSNVIRHPLTIGSFPSVRILCVHTVRKCKLIMELFVAHIKLNKSLNINTVCMSYKKRVQMENWYRKTRRDIHSIDVNSSGLFI